MKKVNKRYVDNLINKMLNETLEERADELMSKIKTNVNELGGMEDDHPKFGKLNFSKMSPEEIEALMNDYVDSDDEEESETMRGRFFDKEDKGDDEWTELDINSDTELEEGHDDPYIQRATGGRDYSSREYKRIPQGRPIDMRNLRDDSITPSKYFDNKMGDISDLLKGRHRDDDDDDDYNYDFGDDDDGGDLVSEMEQSLCECGSGLNESECNECGDSYMNEMEQSLCECGSGLDESECNECGKMDEDIYKVAKPFGKKTQSFDYVEEGLLDDEGDEEFDYTSDEPNVGGCKAVKDTIRNQGGKATDLDKELMKRYKCKSEMTERLHGRQRVLDKDKNGILNKRDFELMRKGKKSETEKEVEEGNEFTGELAKARKEGKTSFTVDGEKYPVKESIETVYRIYVGGKPHTLNENEVITLIEDIVKKESKLKTIGGKPKGLTKYEEVHNKDGKENDEYLKSVAAKMKEYLKDSSKGEYTESPKHFPKGNGQLEKMKAKKYTMSDDGKEFLDRYMKPGMEDLVPEEIEYDEDWVSDNIEGSSRTGNSSEYGNAEETDLGKKINKKRKDKKFHKAKETAYRKTRVPVADGTGENSGSGIHIKESETKESKILNEEFNKIQHLMNYDRKTQ